MCVLVSFVFHQREKKTFRVFKRSDSKYKTNKTMDTVMWFRRWPGDGQATSRYLGLDETKWPPFSDDIFKCIFVNENFLSSIRISLEISPKVPIDNTSVMVQIMVWRRSGDKPLSETMMVNLTYACSSLSASMTKLNYICFMSHALTQTQDVTIPVVFIFIFLFFFGGEGGG